MHHRIIKLLKTMMSLDNAPSFEIKKGSKLFLVQNGHKYFNRPLFPFHCIAFFIEKKDKCSLLL